MACTEAASSYQRSVSQQPQLEMTHFLSVKLSAVSLLQICSHCHGEQTVRHAARRLHGHRPAPRKEGGESGQVGPFLVFSLFDSVLVMSQFAATVTPFACSDLNVTRSASLWRGTGVWRKRCRSTRPLSPSTVAALHLCTTTA